MKHPTQTTHKSPHALMLLSSCVLTLLFSVVCSGAGALPETARLMPPETVLLVKIEDFDQLRAQFEKTSFYKLCKDPAMAAFVDDFGTKWRKELKKTDNEFAGIISDVDALPQGKVAVAFVLNEQTKDADEAPFLFMSQWGQGIAKIKEAVNKAVEKAIADGAHRKTEDYRGVSITAMSRKSSQALNYCFIDDCLIGAMNADVLKFVIAHIKGAGSPTLADDDDYTATMKTVRVQQGPADGQIDLYVNIKQILKTVIAEDDAGEVKPIISNLGLDNVTSFGCSIGLAAGPGGSSSGKAILKIDGLKKGICKMLELEPAALRTPPFVPASACAVSFVNLDIKNAFAELGNILTSFSPQFAAMMQMPLSPPGPQGEPPLQLKTGIIDHLGSQIIVAQSANKPAPDAAPANQSLTAVAISNRSALEKSLSLLHSNMIAPNNPEARRELLGHTIYLIDLAGFLPILGQGQKTPMQAPIGPGTPKPEMPKLAFTVTDTHLIFASEPAVERVIRTLSSPETASVASADWFTKAKSIIPSMVGLADLQDNAASSEDLWSTMRKSKKADDAKTKEREIQMGVGMSSGSILPQLMLSQAGVDLFDFSLLPEFDAVRKYFGLSAFYGLSRPDGFFFEFKYLDQDPTQ